MYSLSLPMNRYFLNVLNATQKKDNKLLMTNENEILLRIS